LDPCDKILTSAAFIGFAAVGLIPWWMVIIIVGRDVLITLLRLYADMKSYTFTTSYYAKWKTMFQMIFLYYVLILYIAQFTPEINSVYGDLISTLLNRQIIFFIALLITGVTFHSGVLYIMRNWQIILKMLKVEN
jgi:CDP-diacylglycerol--glycerol-3-phosphate 3-phosphatidyltransferase